jgi:hypothetical protein
LFGNPFINRNSEMVQVDRYTDWTVAPEISWPSSSILSRQIAVSPASTNQILCAVNGQLLGCEALNEKELYVIFFLKY